MGQAEESALIVGEADAKPHVKTEEHLKYYVSTKTTRRRTMTEGELQKRLDFLVNLPSKVDPKVMKKWVNEAKQEIFEAFDTSKVETWHKLKKWFGDANKS